MCGIVLDTVVMFGVIALVSGEKPEDYLTPLLVSVGFAVAMAVCFGFLPPILALAALVPLVILFGVILSALFGMPLTRAILGSAIFLGYKLLILFLFAMLLG
jgi:hypothetical protein